MDLNDPDYYDKANSRKDINPIILNSIIHQAIRNNASSGLNNLILNNSNTYSNSFRLNNLNHSNSRHPSKLSSLKNSHIFQKYKYPPSNPNNNNDVSFISENNHLNDYNHHNATNNEIIDVNFENVLNEIQLSETSPRNES